MESAGVRRTSYGWIVSSVLQNGKALSSHGLSEAGPILAAVEEAERKMAALFADHESLAGRVDAMVEQAQIRGATAIAGASDAGWSLAGAMAYSSPVLSLWVPGTVTGVLLVDGYLASASGIAVAVARAKALGAQQVDALILGITGVGTRRSLDAGGTAIVALSPQLAAA